jgi:hypothetical protein
LNSLAGIITTELKGYIKAELSAFKAEIHSEMEELRDVKTASALATREIAVTPSTTTPDSRSPYVKVVQAEGQSPCSRLNFPTESLKQLKLIIKGEETLPKNNKDCKYKYRCSD